MATPLFKTTIESAMTIVLEMTLLGEWMFLKYKIHCMSLKIASQMPQPHSLQASEEHHEIVTSILGS